MTLISSKRLRSRLALAVAAASSTFLTAAAVLMLPTPALSGQSPVKPEARYNQSPGPKRHTNPRLKWTGGHRPIGG